VHALGLLSFSEYIETLLLAETIDTAVECCLSDVEYMRNHPLLLLRIKELTNGFPCSEVFLQTFGTVMDDYTNSLVDKSAEAVTVNTSEGLSEPQINSFPLPDVTCSIAISDELTNGKQPHDTGFSSPIDAFPESPDQLDNMATASPRVLVSSARSRSGNGSFTSLSSLEHSGEVEEDTVTKLRSHANKGRKVRAATIHFLSPQKNESETSEYNVFDLLVSKHQLPTYRSRTSVKDFGDPLKLMSIASIKHLKGL